MGLSTANEGDRSCQLPGMIFSVGRSSRVEEVGQQLRHCPECGAPMPASGECWSRVYELLEIETRELAHHDPEAAKRAHFFAIAVYQLQHPSRLTAEAATALREGVRTMLGAPRPIDDLRRDVGRFVRHTKVTRLADPRDRSHIDPRWPRRWSTTALDVIAAGDAAYVSSVAAWAEATTSDLDAALDDRVHPEPASSRDRKRVRTAGRQASSPQRLAGRDHPH